MTRKNYTSVNVIIDKSGSMHKLTADTIGGYNTFVAEQKNVPGDVAFTLCLFGTSYQLVHDAVELASVPDLNEKTYRPSGGTALLDALGTTIDNVGQKLAAMPEEERPSKVIFLIITDGEENSSRNYNLDQIRSMVTHQRETYSWEFVFMGANIDAISAGTSLGISATNSVNYSASSVGTNSLYKSVSRSLESYRIASSQQVDFFNQPATDLIDLTNPVVDPSVSATPTTTNTQPLNTTPSLFGIDDLKQSTSASNKDVPKGLFGIDNLVKNRRGTL